VLSRALQGGEGIDMIGDHLKNSSPHLHHSPKVVTFTAILALAKDDVVMDSGTMDC
jgi:hypothetical protein